MRNALVLLGHADPESLNARLSRAYTDALRETGARAESITLSELSFDPVLRRGFAGEQPLEPDLVRVREAIERADHLAWFFPTYWASPPAIVRGLVDRLFLPGWAFRYDEGASGPRSPPPGLRGGRGAPGVTKMDRPAAWEPPATGPVRWPARQWRRRPASPSRRGRRGLGPGNDRGERGIRRRGTQEF